MTEGRSILPTHEVMNQPAPRVPAPSPAASKAGLDPG